MSKTKTKAKRAKAWACVFGDEVIGIHQSKASAARCARGGASRHARLVEHLPGDVLLSREDAEELAEIVAAVVSEREYPLHYGRLLALLRGRR